MRRWRQLAFRHRVFRIKTSDTHGDAGSHELMRAGIVAKPVVRPNPGLTATPPPAPQLHTPSFANHEALPIQIAVIGELFARCDFLTADDEQLMIAASTKRLEHMRTNRISYTPLP